MTIPTDRAVKVAPAAGDLHVRLVQIPRPPAATTAVSPKSGADQRREAEFPGADRLVADGVATLEQEFRHVSQPELVAQTAQHGEQDDVRWKLQVVEDACRCVP